MAIMVVVGGFDKAGCPGDAVERMTPTRPVPERMTPTLGVAERMTPTRQGAERMTPTVRAVGAGARCRMHAAGPCPTRLTPTGAVWASRRGDRSPVDAGALVPATLAIVETRHQQTGKWA